MGLQGGPATDVRVAVAMHLPDCEQMIMIVPFCGCLALPAPDVFCSDLTLTLR